LVSWAGLCPRNDESAGKRRSTRLRKGAPWLQGRFLSNAAGPQCAPKAAISRRSNHRLRSRRGARKSRPAPVAASLLTTIYHNAQETAPATRISAQTISTRGPRPQHVQRLVNRLDSLGYDVKILPKGRLRQVVSF